MSRTFSLSNRPTAIRLRWALLCVCMAYSASADDVKWRACLSQPAEWYRSAEARRIAANVILYQRNVGGWEKNIEMTDRLSRADVRKIRKDKSRGATIDNGATYRQIRFLALMFGATDKAEYREAFDRGLNYLFASQYRDSGGWPQRFPLRQDYSRYITFNDGAMMAVMVLLDDLARGDAPFGFVEQPVRDRAREATERGLNAILRTQISVDGELTAWCAQHDEKNFQPAKARSYEHPSISGSESVSVVRYLMSLKNPSDEVKRSIQSAVRWFDRVRITGLREQRVDAPNSPRGYDKKLVRDTGADDLWARFYEIGTNRPIFSGRDGITKYRFADIEIERRTGYSWYGTWPARLFKTDYPRWQQRWAADENVLLPSDATP